MSSVDRIIGMIAEFERRTVRGREEGTALKDVVGREYETFRAEFYRSFGLRVVTSDHKRFCPYLGFTPDILVFHRRRVVAVEESKGHYTDAPFFKRALTGFAETIDQYLSQGRNEAEIPRMVIGCSTRLNTQDEHYLRYRRIIRRDIGALLDSRYHYLNLLSRDRLPVGDWFVGKSGSGNDTPLTRRRHRSDLRRNIESHIEIVQSWID